MSILNTLDQPFLADAGSSEVRPGRGLDWLDACRANGMARFQKSGMPTPKLEDWKYTRLKSLEDTKFRSVVAADANFTVNAVPSIVPDAEEQPYRFVFVDGQPRLDLFQIDDMPGDVIIGSMDSVLEKHGDVVREHFAANPEFGAMADLNMAMMDSGFVMIVPAGTILDRPVEVVYIGGGVDDPVAYFPRNLIVLGDNAEATLLKYHMGEGVGAYFANAVTDIKLGQNAKLRHVKVQGENRNATHTARTQVRVERDATYDGFLLAIGGRLSRNELHVQLVGEGASCSVNGAYLMRGSEHCDITTRIDHLAPHTTCNEMFRGVLDDQARGVFQGKIVVHKGAQKIEGHQACNTLLLSDGAEIDAKPELEIYADDVKCSHGATTGQIDETALFYLRSRGIPEALARNLLIQSFLGGVLEKISDESLREALMHRIVHWLPAQCFLSDEWRDG